MMQNYLCATMFAETKHV